MANIFGRFKDDIDNRDEEILRQIFQYREETGKGLTFNKLDKLIRNTYKVSMARQTLSKHIQKLIKMGLVNKKLDKNSKLKHTPTILTLSERSWKSMKLISLSRLPDLLQGLTEIDLDNENVSDFSKNIINVLILSLGRLLKLCIEEDDPYQRTILFNITYDLIKKVFEISILKTTKDENMKKEILEVLNSIFEPYAEKYEIEF